MKTGVQRQWRKGTTLEESEAEAGAEGGEKEEGGAEKGGLDCGLQSLLRGEEAQGCRSERSRGARREKGGARLRLRWLFTGRV